MASWRWLEKLKKRHNLTNHCLSDKNAAIQDSTVTGWIMNFPSLIQNFYAKNTCNCEETGLFYQFLPNKTLDFKGETCHGGKHSKKRLTVLLCCNVNDSEKLPPIVIRKCKKLQCLRYCHILTQIAPKPG